MSYIELSEEEVKQACEEFAKHKLECLTPVRFWSWKSFEDGTSTKTPILECDLEDEWHRKARSKK
jgi:hypothetical protein